MQTTMTPPENSDLSALSEQDGALVLKISGEQGSLGWKAHNEAEILAAVERVRSRILIVDLGRVSYGGSELIAFLFRLRRKLHTGGGEMVLAGANANLRSVLGVVRLDRVVRVFDSVPEAVSAVGGAELSL